MTLGTRYTKDCRLRTRADFDYAFTHQSQCFRSQYFVLLLAPSSILEVRFGVVVSKKVSKKAVIRNCLKRFARETFRHQCHRLQSVVADHQCGYHLVCIARTAGIKHIAHKQVYHESLHQLFCQCNAFLQRTHPDCTNISV